MKLPHRSIILNYSTEKEICSTETAFMMNISFDELDYKIILLLNHDGRLSASEIARELNANPRTIKKRIDHLLDSKAITLAAIVNPQAFHYCTAADIFIDVESGFEQEVIQSLLALQPVSYIAYGQGSQELSIEARFKDNGELHDFIRQHLEDMPHICVSRFVLVPRILKNIHQWTPKKEDFNSK
jgi:DNA-binding Lrp family transcriptional regulator